MPLVPPRPVTSIVLALALAGPALDLRAEPDESSAEAEARLSEMMEQVPGLEGVDASVRAGVALLEGEVESTQARETAEKLAGSLPAVVHVESRLEIATDVGQRVRPSLGRARERLERAVESLPLLGIALAIVLAAWLLGRLVAGGRAGFVRRPRSRLLRSLARQIAGVIVLLLGVVLALDLLDATALVGAVLGTAGLAGVALGFAFRDIAENYLASLLLASRQPFAANDHVDIGGQEGKVVRLTTRDTVLMTLDGNHLRLPNSTVFKATILNYTRNPLRRFAFTVDVGDSEDLSRASSAGLAALRSVPGLQADPPASVVILELRDWSVGLRFFGWVDQRERNFDHVRSEAIRLVKAGLEEAGVVLPVPVQELRWAGAGEPLPGPTGADERARREPRARPAAETPLPAPEQGADEVIDRQIAADRAGEDEQDLLGPVDGDER